MNNFVLYAAMVATLVAILAVLRNRLVRELQATTLLLFNNSQLGIIIYTAIMFPGTIIHELSHWIVAELLRVPTGKITIIPVIESEKGAHTQNLGSVATGQTDPFRGLLIGAAPFIVGVIVLFVLSTLMRDLWGTAPWWQITLLAYGLVVMGNSMLVSESDRRNWPIAIGVIALLSSALWYSGIRLTPELLGKITDATQVLAMVLGLTAGLNLATIGASVLVRKTIEKVSHRKVIMN